MDLAEEIVKYLVRDVREHCAEDMELFAKFVDKELLARLDFVLERPFQRIPYTRCGRASEEERRKIRVSRRLRIKSAVGTRTVADRETFQMPGHGFQLSKGDQTFLHAVE